MQSYLSQIYSHPLQDIGGFFAILSALSLLILLWGITDYVFSRGNIDEIEHGNTFVVWGTALVIFFFILWEITRSIFGVI